ncbi:MULTISPECIES: universal stress protein [unclassified Arthrobacter]|uniref:universal stress protein n=1 Tax=unclassified Arthrobacter TaxID=235627 RepID=UPI00159DEE34|nr:MULTISPECIES: universal stress protein [unclassified Arthrobacter]MCQ9162637.1 universal stress protein [Arthrobacter sp. STN4]NVM97380.1 universal stress protein [Arthrobacter sp. SDTb3-6]
MSSPDQASPVAQPDPIPAPTGIVVGVDGSDQSNYAVVWAAREAKLRRSPLHLVTAYTVPIFAASGLDGGYATVDDDVIRQGAEAVLREAAAKVAHLDVEVDARVENGDAAGVLLELSETAELLVFGTRGRGGFLGRLLGSVSSALPAHSKCPTVTVPLSCATRLGEDPGREAQAPVIEKVVTVGVDGSDQARYAVLVAAEQAQRSGSALRIICAIQPYTGSLSWMPAPVDREELFAEIQTQLDAGEKWLRHHFPQLPIEVKLVEGSAVDVLVKASETSELLVMGTRGRGGFAGMMLGSTTDGVRHHAKGPIMVVRDREDPRQDDRSAFGPLLQA